MGYYDRLARGDYGDDFRGGSRRHPGCPCGCGELADECSGPVRNPLGSMTVREPVRTADVYSDVAVAVVPL